MKNDSAFGEICPVCGKEMIETIAEQGKILVCPNCIEKTLERKNVRN